MPQFTPWTVISLSAFILCTSGFSQAFGDWRPLLAMSRLLSLCLFSHTLPDAWLRCLWEALLGTFWCYLAASPAQPQWPGVKYKWRASHFKITKSFKMASTGFFLHRGLCKRSPLPGSPVKQISLKQK